MTIFGTNSNIFSQPFRNNSARELSAFAESAMAVNRVVLQHMSINLTEEEQNEALSPGDILEDDKENILSFEVGGLEVSAPGSAVVQQLTNNNNNNENKLAEKRKAPPFGLSPPSESKLIQRRQCQQKSSQSLNFSCRTKSNLTKNSCDYLVADLVSPNYVESPGC